MDRKDIETFNEIQKRLNTYCKSVLKTLAEKYPEVGIKESATVKYMELMDDFVVLYYSVFNGERALFIPLEYVETENVDSFCYSQAMKVRKHGKMMTEDEFKERAFFNHWIEFCKLFDIDHADDDKLDIVRNLLKDRIDTITTFYIKDKRKDGTKANAEIFTEDELPFLNFCLVNVIQIIKREEFWSLRERDYADQLSKELLDKQIELIEQIKQDKNHTDSELRAAELVLESIKEMK